MYLFEKNNFIKGTIEAYNTDTTRSDYADNK